MESGEFLIDVTKEGIIKTVDIGENNNYQHQVMLGADNRVLYLVKSIIKEKQSLEKQFLETEKPDSVYLMEFLGARFYQYFSQNSKVAEVKFIKMSDGSLNLASKWVNNYHAYDSSSAPKIQGDQLVINVDGSNHNIEGVIQALVLARFIGDYDCVGNIDASANSGYIAEQNIETGEVVYKNVKIDPGAAFSFAFTNLENKALYTNMGAITLLTNKIYKKYIDAQHPEFYTSIPLSMIDFTEEGAFLARDISQLSAFIDFYYPDLDIRDPLIGAISYKDIIKNEKLYQEFSSSIYKIVTSSNEELRSLVFDNTPSEINGENVEAAKEEIFKQLLVRQKQLAQLYALEVEYIKISHQKGDPLSFEERLKIAKGNIIYREIDHLDAGQQFASLKTSVFKLALESALSRVERGFEVEIEEDEVFYIRTFGFDSLISYVQDENFNIVQIILRNRPDLVAKINDQLMLNIYGDYYLKKYEFADSSDSEDEIITNSSDDNEATVLLIIAANTGNMDIIKLLLDYGANLENLKNISLVPDLLRDFIVARFENNEVNLSVDVKQKIINLFDEELAVKISDVLDGAQAVDEGHLYDALSYIWGVCSSISNFISNIDTELFDNFIHNILFTLEQGNSNYPLYFPGFGGDDGDDFGGSGAGIVHENPKLSLDYNIDSAQLLPIFGSLNITESEN